MNCKFLAGLLLLSGCAAMTAENNLWPNPGFESWNDADNKPASPAWRWSIPANIAVSTEASAATAA